jgi:hypothetical protein
MAVIIMRISANSNRVGTIIEITRHQNYQQVRIDLIELYENKLTRMMDWFPIIETGVFIQQFTVSIRTAI